MFSRKRNPAQLKLNLLGIEIDQSLTSKYLGVWFDSKGTWGTQTKYLVQKCQQRINFLRTITGTWWGAHPEDLIKLYKTTILSVIEYGSFCFHSAANCHLIKLERIQYRCLRIALGCMHSTHNASLPSYNPPRVHFINDSSSVKYDLSMKQAIHGQIVFNRGTVISEVYTGRIITW